LIYGKGLGVPVDVTEAFKWFKLAADQGNPDAQADLANMYMAGAGVPKDDLEGLRLLKLAAAQKNPYAEYRLGVIYEEGVAVPKDYFEALKWYKLSSEHGYSNAQYAISVMYMFGYGVSQNMDEAFKWAKMSADQKNMYGLNALGTFYENGWVVIQDLKEAERLYTESALLGFESAKKNVARLRNVEPEEWVKVSYNLEGTSVFVKMPSVELSKNPPIKSIWVKIVDKNSSYAITHDEYECAKQMYRVVERIKYDSNGRVLLEEKTTREWNSIVPNTFAASIVKRACN